MNPYEILQVSEKATAEIIRGAWAILIRECHPDGPKPNEKRARQINEAYAVLKNQESRHALDQQLAAARIVAIKPARHKRRETEIQQQEPVIPAYPPAYPGISEDEINEVIHGFAMHMTGAPPFVRTLVENVAKSAVRHARRR